MSSADVATFEPKRRGLWFKLLIVLCAAVLIFAGWLLLERKRGQTALKKYEQELIAKGEKLTFAEVVSTAYEPKSRDAGIEFVALCSRLQTGAVLIASAPPATKAIASGKLLVITKETRWRDANGRHVSWEEVAEDLERNRDILDEMKALVHKPPLSYPINYRGFSTLLPHLAPMKKSAQWFSASSLYNLHGGYVDRSIEEIEAILLSAQVLEGATSSRFISAKIELRRLIA